MPCKPRCGLPSILALLLAGVPAPTFAGPGWNVETVDRNGDVGIYAAITVDPLNRVLVAYRDESNRTLKVRRSTATGWGPPLVPPEEANNFGFWPGIAADAGAVHVVYHNRPGDPGQPGSYWMRYAGWDGAQWTLQDIFIGGQWASLALDSQGNPHAAFIDFPGAFATYAVLVGSVWATDLFEFPDWAAYTSLSLDRMDVPHIAYSRFEYDVTALVHATLLSDGTWDRDPVLSDPAVQPAYSSLAVDGLDRVHIAFHDANAGALVYYLRDGAVETFTTVDAGGVGEYASLKVDSSGIPHIAYYDFARQDLKYVSGDDWTPVVVDSAGAVGQWAALALDASGQPHIAYYDATERDLKHAWIAPPVAADLGPADTGLLAVRPNPVRTGAGVLITLSLPRTGAADLRVHDVQGRLVRTLIAGGLGAGSHAVRWDGRHESGRDAPAGVYFVRLRAGDAESRAKVVMIR